MGWIGDDWARRVAVTLDNSGGASTIDADVSIPSWFDTFWSTIDAAGAELRVTHADGVTVLDYSVDGGALGGFDRGARAGRIRIDGLVTPGTPSVVLVWLYFDSICPQGAGSTSTTITSPVDGLIDLAGPSQFQTQAQPQRPGSTRPRQVLVKGATEQLNVWVFVRSLVRLLEPGRDHKVHEEPWYLELSVLDENGDNDTGRYDLTKCSIVELLGGRRIALKCHIKAMGPHVVPTLDGGTGGSPVKRNLEPALGLLQDLFGVTQPDLKRPRLLATGCHRGSWRGSVTGRVPLPETRRECERLLNSTDPP